MIRIGSGNSWIFGLLAAALLCLPQKSAAQEQNVGTQPVRPGLLSTTQTNPRGADIVEPASVWKMSRHTDERMDSTYLGIAKIPDPRKNEVGAIVNNDVGSSTLIRLGGAWIYDADGLRNHVTFDDSAREDLLAFRPGPHDEVVSLQGVRPIVRKVGELIVFRLHELYDASMLNPLTHGVTKTSPGSPRLALMRMESTYPGGEAVDLSVVVAPDMRPRPALQAIRLERRDTTILVANLNYDLVVTEEVHTETPWSAGVKVETGMGNARLHADIPATLRPPFSSTGNTSAFYVDATMYLRRENNRWALNAFGMSALSETDITNISHHQVILRADLRFEHGSRFFVLTQLSGEMTDKQYQEFDWDSADYAASVGVGLGHRSFASTGFERTRLEVVAGMRMGENRRVEIFEVRDRSRGIGPNIAISGEYARPLGSGFEVRIGSEASAYSIIGRGHRDEGFVEKGLHFDVDVRLGRSFLGITTYAGISSLWLRKDAEFKDGGRYYENRRFVAPGVAIKKYL